MNSFRSKVLLVGDVRVAGDEDLPLNRFDRLHPLAEARIVDRIVTPTDKDLALGDDGLFDDRFDLRARGGVARHEELPNRVMAGFGQLQSERVAFNRKELVRNLRQHAAAIAERRVGAGGAAVVEIDENLQALLQNGVRLAAAHVGHDADAARVAFVGGIVKTLRARQQRIGAARRWSAGRRGGRSAERVAGVLDLLDPGVHLCTLPHGRAPVRPSFVKYLLT